MTLNLLIDRLINLKNEGNGEREVYLYDGEWAAFFPVAEVDTEGDNGILITDSCSLNDKKETV